MLAALVAGLPRGADQCVATAPLLTSDRRRAVLGAISHADALGWARVPHVAAYVRCRYRGDRERIEWRIAIDGELDREALPMHVRWDDGECEADECDWPIASFEDGVLSLRSPIRTTERRTTGAEAELAAIVLRQPHLLEARITDESVTVWLLDDRLGVRELRRDGEGARLDRLYSWDELEVMGADHALRRDHARRDGDGRHVALDAMRWSDGDAVLAQLQLRLDRLRRRSGARRTALQGELATFALRALEERSEDAAVVAAALAALVEADRADEALMRADRLVVEADFDPDEARRMRALGWELAVRAGHASAAARLVEAGLALDTDDGEALAPMIAEALERDVAGPTRPQDVESELLRIRALADGGTTVPLPSPVVLEPLGIVWGLVELAAEDPRTTPLEIVAVLPLSVIPSATVVALRDGTRMTALPGRALHVVRPAGGTEVLESAAPALRGPGDGPFVVEVRVGPTDAPTRVLRLEGRVRRGLLSLERVSADAVGLDWDRIGRHLITPLASLAEHAFPPPELVFRGEPTEMLERVRGDLAVMRLAECSLRDATLRCAPRPGREHEAAVAAARALGVLR